MATHENDKLEAFRDYLRNAFPDCTVDDWPDSQLGAQRFRIRGKSSTFEAIASDEFLSESDVSEIASRLAKYTLAEHLRDLPDTPVFVTRKGLKLEYE
jgi:hypothetical protein